ARIEGRFLMLRDDAAASRANHVRRALGLRRRRVLRPAQLLEARHEILAAFRTRPAEMVACARLPETPDRAFDVLRRHLSPQLESGGFVHDDVRRAALRRRGDHALAVTVGEAAGLGEAERIAV